MLKDAINQGINEGRREDERKIYGPLSFARDYAKFLDNTTVYNHVEVVLYIRRQAQSTVNILLMARHIVGLITADITEHLLYAKHFICIHSFKYHCNAVMHLSYYPHFADGENKWASQCSYLGASDPECGSLIFTS